MPRKIPTIYFLMISLALLLPLEAALAQEFMGSPGTPGKQNYRLFLKTMTDTGSDTKNAGKTDRDLGTTQFDANLYLPVYQTELSTTALTGKAQKLRFNDLPKDTAFTPTEVLHNYQYGFTYAQKKEENEDSWTLMGSYGSASDDPFSSVDVTVLDITYILRKTESEHTSWMYFLNYSNNRSILNNIPLPGFAYIFTEPDKTSGGIVGLPFFMYWLRPTEKTSMSITFIVPSNFKAQAGYMLWGPLQGNAKVEYGQQVYMRANRKEARERIFYDTTKLAGTLKMFLGRATYAELETGKMVNRSLFDGTSTFRITTQRVKIPDEWYTSLAVQVSF